MAEVTLHENQSAEPGCCGSCKFFDRRGRDHDWVGYCCIDLPPWVLDKTLSSVECGLSPERSLADNRSCDLYQPSPHTFVKLRKWKAQRRVDPTD
jgi:hypothetical protein